MKTSPDCDARCIEIGADRFVLRPVRAQDRRAYADFITRVDATDLRRRYFHPNRLSPDIVFEHYAKIDPAKEVACVAVHQLQEEAEEIVGEVRLHRYPGTSTVELAILVRSDMQRRGLGRALMQKAIDYCATHGLEIIAQIRPENEAMIRLAERSGMQVEHGPETNFVVAHMRLARGATDGSPSGGARSTG